MFLKGGWHHHESSLNLAVYPYSMSFKGYIFFILHPSRDIFFFLYPSASNPWTLHFCQQGVTRVICGSVSSNTSPSGDECQTCNLPKLGIDLMFGSWSFELILGVSLKRYLSRRVSWILEFPYWLLNSGCSRIDLVVTFIIVCWWHCCTIFSKTLSLSWLVCLVIFIRIWLNPMF